MGGTASPWWDTRCSQWVPSMLVHMWVAVGVWESCCNRPL